jgi:hypothetical protein
VLQDAAVVSFTVPEFEQMAASNTRIVMKMLKVFSNQLRRIHKQVSNLLEKEEQLSPEIGLFKVGEYYLKNRQYAQAKYVFSRYLTYYPAGKMASQAAKFVESAENALAKYGDGKGPAPIAEVHGSAAKPDKGKELSGVAKAYYDAVSSSPRKSTSLRCWRLKRSSRKARIPNTSPKASTRSAVACS